MEHVDFVRLFLHAFLCCCVAVLSLDRMITSLKHLVILLLCISQFLSHPSHPVYMFHYVCTHAARYDSIAPSLSFSLCRTIGLLQFVTETCFIYVL